MTTAAKTKPEQGEKLWGDTPEHFERGLSEIIDPVMKTLAQSFYTDGFVKLEQAISADACDEAIRSYDDWVSNHAAEKEGIRTDGRNPRVINLHSDSDPVKRLFTSGEHMLNVLDTLFGYRTSVYTSLSFQFGTEQPLHRDTPVFRTAPEEFYFGVWIALEDATLENGCLMVLRGGHRDGHVDQYDFAEQRYENVNDIPASAGNLWSPYQQAVVEKCLDEGKNREYIEVKKGDAIIWHPQLPHGGSPINNPSLTRRSVVFHVVPEETPVYQADVFFNRSKKNMTTDPWANYETFENRKFMKTGSPKFGGN